MEVRSSKISASMVLKVLRLLASGAVIGLYVAKAFGYVGFDVTPPYESVGALVGASVVGALKLAHLV